MVISMDAKKSKNINSPMNSPKVSIILPTYNRRAGLERAMASVSSQTFQDWELLVVDDSSDDGTAQLMATVTQKDSRIRYINNPKGVAVLRGIVRVLTQGVDAARGVYIARLDDDDYWIDEQKLQKQVAFLDSHPNCVVVGGGVVVVDPNGNERYRYFKKETDEEIRSSALFANPFSHTTVMFRIDVIRAVGGYQSKYIEDWDLWLRAGMRGTFYNFPEYFTAYTMGDNNQSFIHQRDQSRYILRVITAHRREYPNFFWGYAINFGQYCYTFLPLGFRRYLHSRLSAVKRGM